MTDARQEHADQIIMGNVLSAGLGQAPARQAALSAGLAQSTEAVTLNKMCGSGLQAVVVARQSLLAGDARVVIAGGMESMSRAPFLMVDHRAGRKYGHGKILDHMAIDGLEDAYGGSPWASTRTVRRQGVNSPGKCKMITRLKRCGVRKRRQQAALLRARSPQSKAKRAR